VAPVRLAAHRALAQQQGDLVGAGGFLCQQRRQLRLVRGQFGALALQIQMVDDAAPTRASSNCPARFQRGDILAHERIWRWVVRSSK
jgi:hypothetical protein